MVVGILMTDVNRDTNACRWLGREGSVVLDYAFDEEGRPNHVCRESASENVGFCECLAGALNVGSTHPELALQSGTLPIAGGAWTWSDEVVFSTRDLFDQATGWGEILESAP